MKSLVYVIRRDRQRDTGGIFGFDYLLPGEIRQRSITESYATALDAELAAEKQFLDFAVFKTDIDGIMTVIRQRRHVLASHFYVSFLAENPSATAYEIIGSCPPDFHTELANIAKGLV